MIINYLAPSNENSELNKKPNCSLQKSSSVNKLIKDFSTIFIIGFGSPAVILTFSLLTRNFAASRKVAQTDYGIAPRGIPNNGLPGAPTSR